MLRTIEDNYDKFNNKDIINLTKENFELYGLNTKENVSVEDYIERLKPILDDENENENEDSENESENENENKNDDNKKNKDIKNIKNKKNKFKFVIEPKKNVSI